MGRLHLSHPFHTGVREMELEVGFLFLQGVSLVWISKSYGGRGGS